MPHMNIRNIKTNGIATMKKKKRRNAGGKERRRERRISNKY